MRQDFITQLFSTLKSLAANIVVTKVDKGTTNMAKRARAPARSESSYLNHYISVTIVSIRWHTFRQ